MTGSRTIHLPLLGLAAWVGLAQAAWGQQAYAPAPAVNTFPWGGVVRPTGPAAPAPGSPFHDCPGMGCGGSKMCVQEKQETTIPTPCYCMKCKTICTPTCWFCQNKGCGGCGGCDTGCQVREVRVLMKKFVPVKKCVTVCVPIDVPPGSPAEPRSPGTLPCQGGPALPSGSGDLTTPPTPPKLMPPPR